MKLKSLKNIALLLNIVVLIIALLFSGISIYTKITQTKNNYDYLSGLSNKVILFIGDGMGENHIKVSEKYLDKESHFKSFENQGYMSTFSKSITGPTDSAAAASAMASGSKVNNGEITMLEGKKLTSISELAKQKGLGVGIVTTDALSGATPAAFSSHANSRNDTDEIIKEQAISNIDLFLGAGYETYINYKPTFLKNEYAFYSNYNDLVLTSSKVIASFTKINNYNYQPTAPTLPMLVDYAIDYLEYNYPDGYFLMVEGAHIDKMSHNNDILSMIEYYDEFDNSIKKASEKLSNQNDVSFIVTADHETGDLAYNNEQKADITDNLYNRSGHTSKDVKYYISINKKKIKQLKGNIDNTDIYKIIKALIIN